MALIQVARGCGRASRGRFAFQTILARESVGPVSSFGGLGFEFPVRVEREAPRWSERSPSDQGREGLEPFELKCLAAMP